MMRKATRGEHFLYNWKGDCPRRKIENRHSGYPAYVSINVVGKIANSGLYFESIVESNRDLLSFVTFLEVSEYRIHVSLVLMFW